MSEAPMPMIDEDGTHVFPTTSIKRLNSDATYEDATGEIRWNPRDGVTFRFTIPNDEGFAEGPAIDGATPMRGKGFHEIPTEPAWTGSICGGKEFKLFATGGHARHQMGLGTNGGRPVTYLVGRAAYCELVLESDGPLSFFRATPRKPRYFLSGFDPVLWPEHYEERYNDGNSYISTGSVTLRSTPLLMAIDGEKCGVPQGAWLVYEGECPANTRTPPEDCDEARRFLSFLAGRSRPFLWTDRFSEDEHVTRLYVGVPNGASEVNGNEQPVPLCILADALNSSLEIGRKLASLFEKFCTVPDEFDIDFISSPIWSAFDTYADDKLTFACVSLERLATSHQEFLKKNPQLAEKTQEFLSPSQAKAIKSALVDVVKNKADALGLPVETVRILVEKKINNIHTPPNADKLSEVFSFLGIGLTTEDKTTIDNRNSTLHGRRTMKEQSLEAVTEEIRRFDVLRTLINKAMLRLLDYDGPYIDWGLHIKEKRLPIAVLPPRTWPKETDGKRPNS